MGAKRKVHSDEFKAKVAMEAAKGVRTLSELSSMFSIHPTVISHWKRQLLESGADVFGQNGAKEQRDQPAVEVELYEQIGRLKMELEWVKKKSAQFV